MSGNGSIDWAAVDVDCPAQLSVSRSVAVRGHFETASYPWVSAGWPVIPVRRGEVKGRATPKGTLPSNDWVTVEKWARNPRYKDCNVGVVITGLRVVVLDIESEVGERSLASLLTQAGVDLPKTFEENTGKPQGRHLLFRLPDDVLVLPSQHHSAYRATPDLDVLFAGLFVGTGSIHANGRRYAGNGPIPRREDLPVLPLGLYEVLRARAKRLPQAETASVAPPEVTPRGPAVANTSRSVSPAVPLAGPRTMPTWVRQWLQDASDRRDARTCSVVADLVVLGWADAGIVEVVLAAPLGVKAREEDPSNPARWVQHKIDWARQRQRGPRFDPLQYWWSAHTSGMSSIRLRILDCLLGYARRKGGRVTLSAAQIGLGSASTKVDEDLRGLVHDGWLVLVDEQERVQEEARTYRLVVPTFSPGLSVRLRAGHG